MTDHRKYWMILLALTAGLLGPIGQIACVQGQSPTVARAELPTQPKSVMKAAENKPSTRPVPPRSDEGEQQLVPPRGDKGMGDLTRTLLALAVVVALIFLVRYLLRRLGAGRRGLQQAGAIEIVARTGVSARQELLLVRLGRRLVLVGSGPEGMVALAEVTDPDEAQALLKKAEASPAISLRNLIKGPSEEANSSTSGIDAPSGPSRREDRP